MSILERVWEWFLNPDNRGTVALVGGAVATIVAGFWALYRYFSRPPTPEVKQPVSGIVAGRDVSAGRDITIINKNFPLEQFENLLEKRNKEILEKIAQADPEQRSLLVKELAAITAKYDDLEKAHEDQKDKLAEAYRALDDFNRAFPPEQIKQAREALSKGSTQDAEALFKKALEMSSTQAAEAAYQLGVLAESRIDYITADHYYYQAMQLEPVNYIYLNGAANIAITLGRYKNGESIFKKSLEIINDNDTKQLVTSLIGLAEAYRYQGKTEDSEQLYANLINIIKNKLGENHLYMAILLNNLGGLKVSQSKHNEASFLYWGALRIMVKNLGSEHPQIATTMNNMASLSLRKGDYKQAEKLFNKSLYIRQKTLGPEHPDIAQSFNNLGILYRKKGEIEKAELNFCNSLKILENKLGQEHPHVLIALENLAELLKITGREEEARQIEKRIKIYFGGKE